MAEHEARIGCIHDRFHSGAIARFRCAGMEQRHVIARRKASIGYGAMRTQIDSNDLPNVLCWLAYAAEKFHDRRYGLTHAGAYHGNGFAVVEGFYGLAFRLFVTNDVGLQEVRIRQVDEVLKADRRGAIETNCRGHVAWKPAIGRQEGKARQVSGISGQRIAEPAPADAIMLHYRVASRSIDRKSVV